MNKCKITKQFLKDIRVGLKGGKTNRKTRLWLQKWPVTAKGNTVFYQKKPLVRKGGYTQNFKKRTTKWRLPSSN